MSFSDLNVANSSLYLEVIDPTYIYQGAQAYRFYDGGTPVSSEYMPAAYPQSHPEMLMDENVTLILNPF